jgi:hypothetical protein
MNADRGQAFTLEAIVGAILVLASLVFALQVTAVTPLSASTSSQHIENQQDATVEGALAAAYQNEALKRAVLYGSDTADGNDDGLFSFHETSIDVYYTNRAPTNQFGAILNRTFEGRGLAYNVYVTFQTTSGGTERIRMVYQGVPSDNAAAAQREITLYDDDVLYEPESDGNSDDFDVAQPTSTELESAGDDFYAQDISSGPVFNVVEVEVITWRQ